MSILSLFDYELKKPRVEIAFNYMWEVSPGDLSGAVEGQYAPLLKYGEVVKVYSHRIIIIGTRFGNMVVVQKNDDPCGMIHYYCSNKLDHALGFPETTLNYEGYNRVFSELGNVGFWLEEVRNNFMIAE